VKAFYRIIFLFTIVLFVANCARTGRPEGGPKDEDAPLFINAIPPYKTVKFDEKVIKLNFNEFITLKELNKQLVISPPLKNPPLISPQGSPSKEIKIEILDTLQKNTTYIFNFGNAVQDNNESNILENFSYVFSTGNYIDSLTTNGTIKDATLQEIPRSVNVLLYRIDSSYKDSIIYKKKPNYITNTLDTTNFKFTNLREGKYFIVALKEEVSDYLFNPKLDKIGFLADTIQLPKDSILVKPITLFKEKQPYKFVRAREVYKGKLQFAFEGTQKNMKIEVASKVPENFKSISKFEKNKDSLNFWFTPFETDSLNFIVTNELFSDTVTVKLRKEKIDSLSIDITPRNTLNFRDTIFVNSNHPILQIDTLKISLVDKDTLAIKYTTLFSEKVNKIGIIFDKKPSENYTLTALPSAFLDIYSFKNDTISVKFTTKKVDDYGRITLTVNNFKDENLIVELLSGNKQDLLIERKLINTSTKVIFDLLEPKKYTIRVIVDSNKNSEWDTGNFLKKQFPERIIYHKELTGFELRANFFLEETFDID
jgi:uncharacterized protein (DUF2141 family)